MSAPADRVEALVAELSLTPHHPYYVDGEAVSFATYVTWLNRIAHDEEPLSEPTA